MDEDGHSETVWEGGYQETTFLENLWIVLSRCGDNGLATGQTVLG